MNPTQINIVPMTHSQRWVQKSRSLKSVHFIVCAGLIFICTHILFFVQHFTCCSENASDFYHAVNSIIVPATRVLWYAISMFDL